MCVCVCVYVCVCAYMHSCTKSIPMSTACNLKPSKQFHPLENFFASGSRDGVILLWSTNTLSAMKMFSCGEISLTGSLKESHPPLTTLTSQIKHILAIGEVSVIVREYFVFKKVSQVQSLYCKFSHNHRPYCMYSVGM